MTIVRSVAFIAVLCWAAAAAAQETSGSQPDPASAVSGEEGPVVLPPPSEQAVRFYKSGILVWLLTTFWNIAVPAAIVFTGLSARMRTAAQRVGRKWFFILVVYVALYGVVTFLLELPVDFYRGYVRMHQFGLSNQTFAKWFTDGLISLGVTVAGMAAFLWIPYLLIKKSPKRWWLYTGLLMYPYFAFVYLISPVVVDPLFNDFTAMTDKNLEKKILDLASRAGIEGGRVYQVNKSEDTKAYNAYVTGVLNTKRIVLWDTTIEGLNERQLLFVMAHEMGHFVLGHVYSAIVIAGTLVLIGLYFVYIASGWILRRYGDRIGFHSLADFASYPLIMCLIYIALLVLQPLAMLRSRHQEHEADRFGLEITRDNYGAASAFVKLYEQNLGYPRPHPLVKAMTASHPPIGERVDFCNTYKPWQTGEKLKYEHLFDPTARAE